MTINRMFPNQEPAIDPLGAIGCRASEDDIDMLDDAAQHIIESILAEPDCDGVTPNLIVLSKEFKGLVPGTDDAILGESLMDVIVLAVPFNEPDEKHRILDRIGKQFHDVRRVPVAMAFISEAWGAKMIHNSDTGEVVRPSECQHRIEIIHYVVARPLNDVVRGGFLEVTRDSAKHMRRNGDWTYTAGPKAEAGRTMQFNLIMGFWRGFIGAFKTKT